ncbi:MAG: extracellular solute-binding protein, partial [Oscillospiraceae bacterium]|nr:extracellular solute-binding protein [Oscillospiraceae bacterium]
MKRIITLSLALIMIFALASCTGTQSGGVADTDPLTKDDVISLLIPSSASWPINENMKLFEYMAEGSGATLDVTPIPATDAVTKYPLLFAAREELPDIIAFQVVKEALPYAGAGLVALDDMAEYMPNYNAWLASLSEDQYAVSVNNRIASDGKVYYTPGTGREGTARMYAWLYREDIFKKHGLTAPTTYDELYEVCKKLKEIYPNAYPFCLRQGFSFVNAAGSSFDKWWETTEYYDFDDEEWRWGATED